MTLLLDTDDDCRLLLFFDTVPADDAEEFRAKTFCLNDDWLDCLSILFSSIIVREYVDDMTILSKTFRKIKCLF